MMRNLVLMAALTLGAACASGAVHKDSSSLGDSVPVVAGPPAIPSTLPSRDTTPPVAPASASRPKPVGTVASAALADTVRGKVSVVGTSFDKHFMIVESARRRVEVVGPLAATIGRVAGTDIVAWGRLNGTQLEATSFIVRSVEGQPAIDGTLRTADGALFIVEADGKRTRIAAPPPPLRGRDGARVWITGDPSQGVASFGFIDPPGPGAI